MTVLVRIKYYLFFNVQVYPTLLLWLLYLYPSIFFTQNIPFSSYTSLSTTIPTPPRHAVLFYSTPKAVFLKVQFLHHLHQNHLGVGSCLLKIHIFHFRLNKSNLLGRIQESHFNEYLRLF